MKFIIVSEKKSVPISSAGMMEISELVQYWMEHLNLGYRMVDTCGGYVSGDGSYVHERSYEMTVNAPMSSLSKLNLLARCIARLANQEEVWIEYGRKTLKVTKDTKLESDGGRPIWSFVSTTAKSRAKIPARRTRKQARPPQREGVERNPGTSS